MRTTRSRPSTDLRASDYLLLMPSSGAILWGVLATLAGGNLWRGPSVAFAGFVVTLSICKWRLKRIPRAHKMLITVTWQAVIILMFYAACRVKQIELTGTTTSAYLVGRPCGAFLEYKDVVWFDSRTGSDWTLPYSGGGGSTVHLHFLSADTAVATTPEKPFEQWHTFHRDSGIHSYLVMAKIARHKEIFNCV